MKTIIKFDDILRTTTYELKCNKFIINECIQKTYDAHGINIDTKIFDDMIYKITDGTIITALVMNNDINTFIIKISSINYMIYYTTNKIYLII